MKVVMAVLIIGAGLFAHELRTVFENRGCVVRVCSRSTGFDITKPLRDGVGEDVSLIVNAAGYTNVDAAEQLRHEAFAVNALGAERVAILARALGVRLVHVSTDMVFFSSDRVRRTELDTPCPVSVYGQSKLLGERLATQAYPETIVVRLANMYGERGKNWASLLRGRLLRLERIRADTSREVAPTWGRWPAEVVYELARGGVPPGGLYHVCPRDLASWSYFADEMARHLGVPVNRPASVEIPYQALRSRVGALDSHMLSLRGIETPTWKDLLHRYLKETTHERG